MKNLDVFNGSHLYLRNPIIMLFAYALEDDSCDLLQRSLEYSQKEHIIIQTQENNVREISDVLTLSDTGTFDQIKEELDRAVRRTKERKHFNNNDLTVCLFLDSKSVSSSDIIDKCKELYLLLKNAYYNNIYFDVYYLIINDFVVIDSGRKTANEKVLALSKNEWVRNIYLLGDVDSDGRLITNRNELFIPMLNSVLLTNCIIDNENVNRLQDILSRESEESKFFCIGSVSFYPFDHQIQQLVRTELLDQLFNDEVISDTSFEMPGFIKSLYNDILDRLNENKIHISRSAVAPKLGMSNIDYLDLFLSDELIKEINETEIEVRKEFHGKIDSYWNKLKKQINDFLNQVNISFWSPQYVEYIVKTVISYVNQLRLVLYNDYVKNLKRYKEWNEEKINIRKPKYNMKLAEELFEKWCYFQNEKKAYIIFDDCVKTILDLLKKWQKKVSDNCETFYKIKYESDFKWMILLKNCTNTQKPFLKYIRCFFSEYLSKNPYKVNACRQMLNGYYDLEFDSNTIENTIEYFITQFEWEIKHFITPNPEIVIPDSEIKKMNKKLYQTIEKKIFINLQRYIQDTEPYICYYGNLYNRFIEYIQKENHNILLFENHHISDQILYFQSISSDNIILDVN